MPESVENGLRSAEREVVFVLPDREKLEALAEFAAGAGHEINNPLATIIGRAQMLLKDERDPQRRQMLMSIGAQAYRVRDMIGDAMLFGRPPQPVFSRVNLSESASTVISRQAETLATEGCHVLKQIPETMFLHADPTQLFVVIAELIRNSRQALSPAGGTIEIFAEMDGACAVIEFRDHGKGFTEIEQRHAFDPFFSGRQAGRGLGFGLSKVWRIVDQHSGRIEIESKASGPTVVRIVWPLAGG